MNTIKVDEALEFLMPRVPLSYIAKRMEFNVYSLSGAKSHKVVNGKPYYLPADRVEQLRTVVYEIGKELRDVSFKEGDDVSEQLNTLKNTTLNIAYIASGIDKSYDWLNQRLSHREYMSKGKMYGYYNKFKPEEIKAIQDIIHTIGIDLMSLDIVSDAPGE